MAGKENKRGKKEKKKSGKKKKEKRRNKRKKKALVSHVRLDSRRRLRHMSLEFKNAGVSHVRPGFKKALVSHVRPGLKKGAVSHHCAIIFNTRLINNRIKVTIKTSAIHSSRMLSKLYVNRAVQHLLGGMCVVKEAQHVKTKVVA